MTEKITAADVRAAARYIVENLPPSTMRGTMIDVARKVGRSMSLASAVEEVESFLEAMGNRIPAPANPRILAKFTRRA